MKKSLTAVFSGLALLALTACAEVPSGVDEQFHTDAYTLFIEVDEDTMEMELSDQQDHSNISLLGAKADSKIEQEFVRNLKVMADLQDEVLAGKGGALNIYLETRNVAMNTMNLDDAGQTDTFSVPKFEFIEEDDY